MCTTLLQTAVIRRATPSSCCGPSWCLSKRVTSINTLLGTKAHTGTGAGTDVRRCVRQPREILCLGGRHCKAHWRHCNSLGNRGKWMGLGDDEEDIERDGVWGGRQGLASSGVLTWVELGCLLGGVWVRTSSIICSFAAALLHWS